MDSKIDSILEGCIARLLAHEATVQDCLDGHAALSRELEPLLKAAEQLAVVRASAPSPEARARMQQRVLAQVRPSPVVPRLVPRARSERRPVVPTWRWAMAAVGVVVLIVLLAALLAMAAGGALPGRPSAAIALRATSIPLPVSLDPSQADRRLGEIRERLGQIETLAVRGDVDLADVSALAQDTEELLGSITSLAPEQALPRLDTLIALLQEEEQTLSTLLLGESPADQTLLAAAIKTVKGQLARAISLAAYLRATPSPAPSTGVAPSPVPSGTASPGPPALASPTDLAPSAPGATATALKPTRVPPTATLKPTRVPPTATDTPTLRPKKTPPGHQKTPGPPPKTKPPGKPDGQGNLETPRPNKTKSP